MNEYIMQPIDIRQWVSDNVMTTPEAIEYLVEDVSHMIKNGKVVPLKKQGCVSLFLLEDLEKKKEELMALQLKYRPDLYE